MDVTLLTSSIWKLPTAHRAAVLVYDGTANLQLAPGPGPDLELVRAYGTTIKQKLSEVMENRDDEDFPLGSVVRLHPGMLACDFLCFVVSRGPEVKGERPPAPNADVLTKAVRDVLEFCQERGVVRIAFPALGAGPGELEVVERLALAARTAHAWYEERFQAGRPTTIEEVIVCDASNAAVSAASRKVHGAAKQRAVIPNRAKFDSDAPRPAKKAASSSSGASKPRRGAPKLTNDEIEHARGRAALYDRASRYAAGQFLLHPKFGVGRVETLTPEGAIMVLFEDGEQRKMLHAK